MDAQRRVGRVGRPVATTRGDIEQVAFEMFGSSGFEGTTMAAIAAEVGVGPRTLFRYYRSKNDIPWGRFEETLHDFQEMLGQSSPDLPLVTAVQRAVLRFNEFDPAARPSHRERMRLILRTPALQAHSMLRYADWRSVISGFVAERLEIPPDGVFAQTVAQVSLALALTAYDAWLDHPDASLPELLEESLACLAAYVEGSTADLGGLDQ